MTYEGALEYIHGISWTFCKPGLERIRELCHRLGNPQDKLSFVHVAGTNGKGSFCSMLSSILAASGLRVGLFTSPYVLRFNERMRVNDECISDDTLARITDRVRPIADAMTDKPTEFELITAIALLYFLEQRTDVVVLECGMGGRLDSTNIISTPLLSVITGVALDHTGFLGDTVEKIAAEKAGIIKKGVPVLYGGEDEYALRVISDTANALGSRLIMPNYKAIEINELTLEGARFSYKERNGVKIRLLGEYQVKNAALVLEATDALKEQLKISEAAVTEGLCSAKWSARFERLCDTPPVFFDGAHNPQGIESATRSIRLYYPGKRVLVVTGVLADKDYRSIAKSISEVALRVYTISPDSPRALSAEDYAEIFTELSVMATPACSIREALHLAREEAERAGAPIFFLGSLYTYSDVIDAINARI